MGRSRAWCGAGAVAVAAVGALVLAWPAVSATGLPTQTNEGTLVVSASGSVTASVGTVLTFTFTGPAPSTTSAPPFRAIVPDATVTVAMPQGWTAATPSDLTCTPPGCTLATPTSAGFSVALYPGANSFTLEAQATPPGDAGPASFTATEVSQNTTLTPVTSSPLNVICPTDGLGTMVVNPSTVAVASGTVFTFTYTAGSCGASPSGSVGVTVPSGWTSPGQVGAAADNLAPGSPVTFTYGPAQASSTGPATFVAWQAADGGPPQNLASFPVVVVTPTVVSSSSSSSSSSSPPPSSSAPSSTSATTAPPTSAPPTTTPPTTAPPTSAPPTGSGPGEPGSHLPISLVASGASAGGLVLLAGVGGLLAARSRRQGARLRRGGHGAGGGNVRAVPRTGPPPSIAVRDTGTTPTLTVRLLPYAGATTTTIKEQGP